MARVFAAKAPSEIKRYTWHVPVVSGDSLASVSAPTASGVTVDSYDIENDDFVLYVSGGTAGNTASITLHAVSDQSEEFDETAYIAILPASAGAALSETAQTVIEFALRPITGLSGTATSDELADGLEWLNMMLLHWRQTGASLGVHLPLDLTDQIYAPDEWLMAVKLNLRVMLAEQYGPQVSPITMRMATVGLAAIKNDYMDDRDPTRPDYY